MAIAAHKRRHRSDLRRMVRGAVTLMVNALRAIIVARTPTAQDYAKEFKSMAN